MAWSPQVRSGEKMAQDDYEGIKNLLRELEKNKFAKHVAGLWDEQVKLQKKATLVVVLAVLVTIVLLNLWGKLTSESNGWIIAALIGYLFGRGQK